MPLNNEDEFGTRPATEEEFRAWDASNIRGVRSVPGGIRVDSRGNRVNVYNVVDDEFSVSQSPYAHEVRHDPNCQCPACQAKAWQYMNWHQTRHRHVKDPRCKICQAEMEFRKQHPDLIGKRVGAQP
jgi:hypothetical protein